jgi:hypothetical protein
MMAIEFVHCFELYIFTLLQLTDADVLLKLGIGDYLG